MERFFYPYLTASEALLEGEQYKHAKVLRKKIGDTLELVDGEGHIAQGTILAVDKKNIRINILSKQHYPKPKSPVTLGFSPLKNKARQEWLLEKLGEIGVAEIIPFVSKYTEKKDFKASERINGILTSALKQSGNVYLPKLSPCMTFAEILKINADQKYIPHLQNGDKNDIKDIKASGSKIIIIGPEGGFSEEEINSALKAGFIPLNLGPVRFRAETAAVLSAYQLV